MVKQKLMIWFIHFPRNGYVFFINFEIEMKNRYYTIQVHYSEKTKAINTNGLAAFVSK